MSGEYISKEQFYKACHISKRSALWLIQNGLIAAIDTGRKTDRYLIPKDEVRRYLQERELDPAKYRYVRGSKSLAPVKERPGKRVGLKRAKAVIQQVWKDEPDLLRIQEVIDLLGYPRKRIEKWRAESGMSALVVSHTLYFPKKQLIDFVLSPAFQSVSPKSAEHLELLRRIKNEGL